MMSAGFVLEITLFTMQLVFSRSEGNWLNERNRVQELQNKVSKLLTALHRIDQETQRERNKHSIKIPALNRRTIAEDRHSNTNIFHGKSLVEWVKVRLQ